MVRDVILWQIGNGKSVDFLWDKWVKDLGALINVCTQLEIIPDSHVPVVDFVSPSGDWNWTILKKVLPPTTILVIASYKSPMDADIEDFMGWEHDKKSCFSVTYSINCGVQDGTHQGIWKHIWHIPMMCRWEQQI